MLNNILYIIYTIGGCVSYASVSGLPQRAGWRGGVGGLTGILSIS